MDKTWLKNGHGHFIPSNWPLIPSYLYLFWPLYSKKFNIKVQVSEKDIYQESKLGRRKELSLAKVCIILNT